MKKLLPILFVLIITSCSKSKVVDDDQVVKRNGLTYEINSNIPFTGTVIGFPMGTVSSSVKNIKISQTDYKDGLEHGEVMFFHKNGQVKWVYSMKKGQSDGLSTFFSRNGEITGQSCYKEDKLLKDMSLCKK